MIQVDQICYAYPQHPFKKILDRLSFTIEKGEKVALMGANGSGKTTLAQCLNGLILPDSGQVVVDNICLNPSESVLFEIRKRVGMVFQNPDNQIVSATVEREVAFGLENLGIESRLMRQKVDDVLFQFQLDSYRHHAPHLLSGGERQRLALASVLAMQPDYLILDEPTSLLDPEGRTEILELLKEHPIFKNMGVLFVTQFSEEALAMDRLIVLDRGQVVFDANPVSLFEMKQTELKQLGLTVPIEFLLDKIRMDAATHEH